jgi:hypothetical protein
MDGARAIAFAIEQPADIGVNEIVICPTAQILASPYGIGVQCRLAKPFNKVGIPHVTAPPTAQTRQCGATRVHERRCSVF